MAFDLRAPDNKNTQFEYALEAGGLTLPCYLTYSISRKAAPARDLLLVDVIDDRILEHLSDATRAALDALNDTIAIRSTTGGAIAVAKAIAVDIESGRSSLTKSVVAVHRFGAVPVITAGKAKDTNFTIGLYPHATLTRLSGGAADQPGFLGALGIRPDIQFARYFEDIGAAFEDIESNLGIGDALAWTNKIERTLSQSIDTKLIALRGGVNTTTRNDTDRVRRAFPESIVAAEYAASYTVFLLATFFEFMGISRPTLYRSRSKLKRRRPAALRSFAAPYCYEYPAAQAMRDVYTLDQAMSQFLAGSESGYKDILSIASPTTWVRQYLAFTAFLASLRSSRRELPSIGVFLSGHHEVPVTETIGNHLESYIASTCGAHAQVLRVKEHTAQLPFKYLIAKRIWAADSVVSIIPADTRPISHEHEKDYKWIAREMEYAAMLRKAIIPLVEAGTDMKKVLADVTATTELFAPAARIQGKRTDAVLRILGDQVIVPFLLRSMDHLDEELKRSLAKEILRIRVARTRALLSGLIESFSPSVRDFIAAVNMSGAASARKLFEALTGRTSRPKDRKKNAANLHRLHRRVLAKSFVRGEHKFRLVTYDSRGKQFYGELRFVIDTLLGDAISAAERAQLYRDILVPFDRNTTETRHV